MSSIKNISLYVPHIFANFDEDFVKDVFNKEVGKVSRVDFVSKIGKNCKPYNAAYIHFELWYETDSILQFQESVIDPNEEAHLFYDGQWYWIVLENTAKKFIPGQRKTCIDIGTPTKQNIEVVVAPNAPKKLNTQNWVFPSPITLADRIEYSLQYNNYLEQCIEENEREYRTVQEEEEHQKEEYFKLEDDLEDLEDLDYLREVFNIEEDELNMEEIEAAIEEEEAKIINEQYVNNLEAENDFLKEEIKRLQSTIYELYNPSAICGTMW